MYSIVRTDNNIIIIRARDTSVEPDQIIILYHPRRHGALEQLVAVSASLSCFIRTFSRASTGDERREWVAREFSGNIIIIIVP